MKLLLTSNGLTSLGLEQAFLKFTGGRTDLRVAIIPTAGDPIEWVQDPIDKQKYTAKLLSQPDKNPSKLHLEYVAKGFSVVIADLKEDPQALREKLENVDIIDVPGGDVNYLLDWAKKAELGTYLKDILARDVLYVGSSAGTGLVVPDVGLTWWEPSDSTDHVSFGIVDFVVVPHQKESDERSNTKNLKERKKYLQTVMDFPWKVYLLQDGQAVMVDGEKVEHIGPGEKMSI